MDELFEILTLVQTHKIYSVPIILVGSDFWNKIDEMMRNEMLTKEMIDATDLKLYKITDDLDEVVKIIKEAPIRDMSSFSEQKVEELKEKSNEN
jgi:predicted Rossmann-fold nucleotide-binding protein